ncbi:MAG: T9SS type A sorting domain-containing protein, partial [Luteibaculum sp.]
PDQPIIGNDSIISVSAIFDGENVFKIRRFISTPKGCSYALDFGSETFYNYQEPDVSFDVDNNKICRGDTAYIPISVSASDSVIIEYSINGVKKTITASADTLLAVKEDFDFDFSIDSVYYASGDGCGKLIDLQQIFEVKDPINFAVTPVKNDCAGETKGQILLSAEGANTTFSLDGSTYFQRTSFDNLASGTYTVFAKAESGCISVKQATIQNKSNLKIDVESKSTTCGNVNGELKVTASLGSEPYHIFINDEEVSNGLFQNDLTEGTYRIYAYDNLTCEVFDTIVIQPSTGVDFSFTENGPIGCDAPDAGVVTIAATGGSGNFTYQLNEQPPQASNVFNGLFAQFYTLRVIDATDGCVKEKRMRIKPQKLFPFTVRILGDLNCSYSKNGRVEAITENNGTTYLYSLDGVNYSFNKLFTNVSAGQFQLYAKELDGCRREQVLSFNMTAPPKLKSRVVYTEDVDCWNAKDGVVGLEGSAGNGGPYKYKRIGETFKANAVFTNLGQGLHTFVTQDNKGCTDTLKVNINGPDTVVVNVTKIDSGNGKATLRVSATNTYLLTLYSLDGINYTTNPVFPDVAPGTYTLYIRDQLGCETVYTFSFTVTGISERVEQLFTVYPNPFENNLRIQFKKAPNTDITNNIRLFDITGKQVEIEVQKLNESSFEIYSDIDLAKGTYIIQAAGKSLKIQKN